MNSEDQAGGPPLGKPHVIIGLIVMLVGALLLFDRLGWWGFRMNVPIWPFIVILLGVARLNNGAVDGRGRPRANRAAIWLMIVGCWGLINEYRLFGLTYGDSWPLLIVGAGAMIVWRAVDPVNAVECGAPHKKVEP
jgi:hypothetical protein